MKKVYVIVILLIASTCYAENRPIKELLDAKTLKCETFHAYGGEFEKKWKFEKSKSKMTFIFDSIDISQGKARFIGNMGSTDLNVLASIDGIFFIEMTATGTPQTSYVFGTKDEDGRFAFIHSRRTSMMEIAMPSQNYGYCTIHE